MKITLGRKYKMENEEVLLTQEGFDKLEKQLEYLKTTERTEIAGYPDAIILPFSI